MTNVIYFRSTSGQVKAVELPNGITRTTVEDAVRAAGIGLWNDEHLYYIDGDLVDGDDHVDAGETIVAAKPHSNGVGVSGPGNVTFVSTSGQIKVVEVPGPTSLEDVVRAVGVGTWNTSHVYSVDSVPASASSIVYAGQTITASKQHSNGKMISDDQWHTILQFVEAFK